MSTIKTTTKTTRVKAVEPKVNTIEWFNKKELKLKANKEVIRKRSLENKGIVKELFDYFVTTYITLDNELQLKTSKEKKEAKRESFNFLVGKVATDYEIQDNTVKRLVTAFENYKDSKCYLDLTQKELMSDGETKNLLYISPSQFIKYFTHKEEGKLYANNISNNVEFFKKFNALNKELAIKKARAIIDAEKETEKKREEQAKVAKPTQKRANTVKKEEIKEEIKRAS